MGKKRKNVPAEWVSVLSGLLWDQEQDKARDTSVTGDRLVTEESVYCTVYLGSSFLSSFLIPQAIRSRMKDTKQVTEVQGGNSDLGAHKEFFSGPRPSFVVFHETERLLLLRGYDLNGQV